MEAVYEVVVMAVANIARYNKLNLAIAFIFTLFLV